MLLRTKKCLFNAETIAVYKSLLSATTESERSSNFLAGTKLGQFQILFYVLILYICTYNIGKMDTKLTLKLDKQVIYRAKEYARSHNRSLSRMIESYLKSLTDKETPGAKDKIEISPFVKSMRTGIKLPADFEHRKEYVDYLAEKHK